MVKAKQGKTGKARSTASFRRVMTRKIFLSIASAMSSVMILLSCVTTGPEDIAIKPTIEPKGLASDENIQFIDTHNHLVGRYGSHSGVQEIDYEGAARIAFAGMKKLGIKKMFIMPPPFPPDLPNQYTFEDLIGVVQKYPDRFAFLGGGGTLNVMIQQAVQAGTVSERIKSRFEKAALEILSKGAVGFGELTAEHFSLDTTHPYETAPPDHPLFLLLSDIAARQGVPMDIHMEAVPEDMPLPKIRRLESPYNPKVLRANIPAFERLLAHNRNAKIIWAHVGWCNTGHRTPALCKKLFERHPNLYMSFKIRKDSMPDVSPFTEDRRIKSEWLNLIQAYPERFLIGSDHFYAAPRGPKQMGPPTKEGEGTKHLLALLPVDLGRKVGYENAIRIFKLER